MNFKLLFFFLCIPILTVVSQNKYLPGSYESEQGQMTEGYILDEDWKAAPQRFTFKKTLEDDGVTMYMDNVLSMELTGVVKFIRRYVNLDTSSDNLNGVTYNRNPMYEKRHLVLEVLSRGKADLYVYKGEGIERFFFSHNQSEIQPLIFKKYIIDNKLKENNRYKQQLINVFVGCDKTPKSKLLNLRYKRGSLAKIFDEYNSCSNVESVSYYRGEGSIDLKLNLKGGVGFASYVISGDGSTAGDYGKNTSYRIEAEMEAILPFYNNKLSAFIGVTKGANYVNTITAPTNSSVNPTEEKTFIYKQKFEAPLGVRYYFFLTNALKLSIHGGYNFSFIKEVGVDKSVTAGAGPSQNIVVGNGFGGLALHYNRFLAEARFEVGKDLIRPVSFGYSSSNNVTSFVIGYSLF